MAQAYKDITNPLETLVQSGRNDADILCPKGDCQCVILRKNAATLVERDGSKLSLPASSLPANSILTDDDTHFWHVSNMMDFENVGFSTTIGTIKYLSCADCDLGPIGYHDTSNPKEFVISIKRAKYRF
ncbi:Mss4-like protein [Gilbertella persicaria]|uniref:Mss4-like protein n=1 Tax=Gilbertella persicaria TaxID=101096 RepID=UPI002220F084|nr:Mss4-like protein [Gilbertella persicaria]KAI8088080.1 Mss4-like protein [Gilbertella persicaria]